jgi:hypothetical protein
VQEHLNAFDCSASSKNGQSFASSFICHLQNQDVLPTDVGSHLEVECLQRSPQIKPIPVGGFQHALSSTVKACCFDSLSYSCYQENGFDAEGGAASFVNLSAAIPYRIYGRY